jgi:hypothetical protein
MGSITPSTALGAIAAHRGATPAQDLRTCLGSQNLAGSYNPPVSNDHRAAIIAILSQLQLNAKE